MSQRSSAVPATPANVISFPFPQTKDPDNLKEKELCFVLALKMCRTVHGLTDEMAEALSRHYFQFRHALMAEGD